MPSIFDKISKVLLGGGKQITPPITNSPSKSDQSTHDDNHWEESPPPPADLVEDAMSLASFRKIAEETNAKIAEASEVPIQLLTNYLRQINKDEDRTIAADQLLQELQSVHELYKENLDRATVQRVITALEPYASEEIKEGIKFGRPHSILLRKATLLPELFENFREAFRCEDQEPSEEKNRDTTTRPRR
jgi:hypothetical protein